MAFGGNPLSAASIGALAKALLKCPALTHVDMSCTPMAVVPIAAASDSLEESFIDLLAALDARRAHAKAVNRQSGAAMLEWSEDTMVQLDSSFWPLLAKIRVLKV